jgi:hypothetical protein
LAGGVRRAAFPLAAMALHLAATCPVPANEFGHTLTHVTLCWIGARTDAEIAQIVADARELVAVLPALSTEPPVFVLRDEAVFGKPDDIKAGKGFVVRKCGLYSSVRSEVAPVSVDAALASAAFATRLGAFYRKWYKHEDGEAKERLEGPQYHITIGSQAHSNVAGWHSLIRGLQILPVSAITLKQKGATAPLIAYDFPVAPAIATAPVAKECATAAASSPVVAAT